MINPDDIDDMAKYFLEQLKLSQECGVRLVTIHPINMKMEDYIELSNEKK